MAMRRGGHPGVHLGVPKRLTAIEQAHVDRVSGTKGSGITSGNELQRVVSDAREGPRPARPYLNERLGVLRVTTGETITTTEQAFLIDAPERLGGALEL